MKQLRRITLAPAGMDEKPDVRGMSARSDSPDKEIDQLWMEEVERRIDAHECGEMQATGIKEVLRKYEQRTPGTNEA